MLPPLKEHSAARTECGISVSNTRIFCPTVAFREATEETGIDRPVQLCGGPVSLEVLNVAAHIKNSAIVSPHLHFNLTYLFEADPSLPLKIKQDENSAVGWRTEAQITAETEEAQIIPIYRKLLSIMKQH